MAIAKPLLLRPGTVPDLWEEPPKLTEEQQAHVAPVMVNSWNWKLPEEALQGWFPAIYTLDDDPQVRVAENPCLYHYSDFEGEQVTTGHGIDLNKNLMGSLTGPRGGTKTLTMSWILSVVMRLGKPVWANYPISFFVQEVDELPDNYSREFVRIGPCVWINLDSTLMYYESRRLDMMKFQQFSKELRAGAVGIDELQYFVEARRSGKEKNLLLSYQIMQIRKTANSFYYTVQNPGWVDNRFGWSSDFEIECGDIAKMPYDREDTGLNRSLDEGELGQWSLKDISGSFTGERFSKSGKIHGPFQFLAWKVWNSYPTHYIIDVAEAMSDGKDKAKQEKEGKLISAIEDVINECLDTGLDEIEAKDMWQKLRDKGVEFSTTVAGQTIAQLGIEKKIKSGGKTVYDLSELKELAKRIQEQEEQEAKEKGKSSAESADSKV